MSRVFAIIWLTAGLVLFASAPAGAREGRVVTLWPVLDYRSSPATDYASLHLLGPLFKWERTKEERTFALRPLVYSVTDGASSQTDLLFPLIRGSSGSGFDTIRGIGLLEDEDREADAGGGHSFTLFPLLFYDRHENRPTTFAVFPLGGRIAGRFRRDDIRFALFPLYSRTRKGSTTVTNVLWPFFARVSGEQESGIKVWPLFGASGKEGTYRKRFWLWPFFYANDLDLDGENPRRQRGFFPLYTSDVSPGRTRRVFLWPLFSFRDDREKGYKEWDFPWPLLGISRGEDRRVDRFLPLFANERRGDYRKRWFLWPIYRSEAVESAQMRRREDRILFFLYRDLREEFAGEEGTRKRRILFWPLLRYQQREGVSRLSLLALLEPFFPESEGVERNWAPLWRLYQVRWDDQGNRVDSLLWNLFWRERRPDAVAGEVFPFVRWTDRARQGFEISLLKGLFNYSSDASGRRIRLFYLPWDISWGEADDQSENG